MRGLVIAFVIIGLLLLADPGSVLARPWGARPGAAPSPSTTGT
jgi:hypothetical protein